MESKYLKGIRNIVRKAINEDLQPSETFTTPIKGKSISFYSESYYPDFASLSLSEDEELFDVLKAEDSSKVFWSFDIDARNWGVKDISISIQNVIVDIEVSSEGEAGYKTMTFDAKSNDFEIENQIEIKQNSVICPTQIEIDFKRKKVTVS
jgi:hypothetical protein